MKKTLAFVQLSMGRECDKLQNQYYFIFDDNILDLKGAINLGGSSYLLETSNPEDEPDTKRMSIDGIQPPEHLQIMLSEHL